MWDYFLLGHFSPSLGVVSQHCPNWRMELEDRNIARRRNVKDTNRDGAQYLRRRKILSAPLREPVNLHKIWKVYMICELFTAANVKITVLWVWRSVGWWTMGIKVSGGTWSRLPTSSGCVMWGTRISGILEYTASNPTFVLVNGLLPTVPFLCHSWCLLTVGTCIAYVCRMWFFCHTSANTVLIG